MCELTSNGKQESQAKAKSKPATALVYRTQLTKSPLTCILHSHAVNNKHLFTQKCELAQKLQRKF